jgi:hypothetical protein
MSRTNQTGRRWFWVGACLSTVLLATVIQLRAQGRLWTCDCERVLAYSSDVNTSDTSQHFSDPYTLTHVLHGVVIFWLLSFVGRSLATEWQFMASVIMESAWEVFENTRYVIERYREATIALGYEGDTILNSMGDLVACTVGFAAARYLGLRYSVVLFAAIEVGLAMWIRDGLLLNVVMLLYPFESILAWQNAG